MEEIINQWQEISKKALESHDVLIQVEKLLCEEMGYGENNIKHFQMFYEEKIEFCLSKHMTKEQVIKKITKKRKGESDD